MAMYRTRGYRVDPFNYTLHVGERDVSLEPKVMRVLLMFLERPGEVISKQELLAEVWEGRFVSDDVVAAAVYQIRKAFSDRASQPRFLQTVHRRGYRWCAPVAREMTPGTGVQVRWRIAAAAVLAILAVGLSMSTWIQSQPVPPPEAWSAYAKGRYFLDRRSPESMRLATRSFEEALRRAPGWSAPRAGLADTLMLQIDLGITPLREDEADARALARRALELDSSSSEAWTSVGLNHLLLDFDFVAAERAFRRGLALDPSNAFAHQAYAWHLSAKGELDAATDHARRAARLAPTLVSPQLDLAFILGLARRHDDAVRQLETALELDRSRAETHAALGWAHTLAGRDQQGLKAFERFLTLTGETASGEMAGFIDDGGVDAFFRFTLAKHGAELGWVARARLHAVLGETDDALDCLERGYLARDTAVLWVATDPAFAALERDERFRHLVRRSL